MNLSQIMWYISFGTPVKIIMWFFMVKLLAKVQKFLFFCKKSNRNRDKEIFTLTSQYLFDKVYDIDI